MSETGKYEHYNFHMTITEIYVIKGRGILVTGEGKVESIQENQAVLLTGEDKSARATVTGFHTSPSSKKLGVLLKGVRRQDIEVGMMLITRRENPDS